MKRPTLCYFLVVTLIFSISIAAQTSSVVVKNGKEEKSDKNRNKDQNPFQKFLKRLSTGKSSSNVKIRETMPAQNLSSWVDDVGDKTTKFLKEKIFGQPNHGSNGNKIGGNDKNDNGFLTMLSGGEDSERKKSQDFSKLFDRLAYDDERQKKDQGGASNKGHDYFVSELLQRTALTGEANRGKANSFVDMLKYFQETMDTAILQFQNTFSDILASVKIRSTTLSMIYFLAHEESVKTPSWKLQQHRFYEKVTKPIIMELHEALYLSQLAYVNTVDEFRLYLSRFQGGVWELAYYSLKSEPKLPAHFLLIHKYPSPMNDNDDYIRTLLPWEERKDTELVITMVIRGTKNLADVLSDALIEPVPYRDGLAHGGILASGKSLVELYTQKLKLLLEASGRDKIKLYIVGHSLGAGAGAIAAMEFKELDFINVEAVGFGCPSLLSRNISESTKGYITTVVGDDDIIPRMSGATIVNAIADLLNFNWTDLARDDIEFTIQRAEETLPFLNILPPKETVLQWADDFLRDSNSEMPAEKFHRIDVDLIPPGNCMHLFRDGIAFTGSSTPCHFFSSIDFSRTMIDDHLVIPGYHRALISMIREWNQNLNFDFPNDIMSIPA